MKLDTFINLNRSTAITIPMSKIALTSNTHVKDIEKGKTITGKIDENSIILVKHLTVPREDGAEYTLVTGWKTYMIAKNKGISEIKAIVVPYTRSKFNYYLSKKPVGVIDFNVITPPSEHYTKPNSAKIEWVKKQCNLLGGHTIDSPVGIKIDKNGVVKITDGYIRYLVAKELGITMLPFTVVKTNS